MASNDLEKFNIVRRDMLKLKPDSESRLANNDELGNDAHWSAKGFYRHIRALEYLVPREASNF